MTLLSAGKVMKSNTKWNKRTLLSKMTVLVIGLCMVAGK